jgi:hypothetical protein
MFLKDEKERLASESAGEVHRLRQEASDLREELARERKSREKLEVRHIGSISTRLRYQFRNA